MGKLRDTSLTGTFPRGHLYKAPRRRLQKAEREMFELRRIDVRESELYSIPTAHPNCMFTLRPHPLSLKLYGNSEPDEALIDSIRKVGIQNPIIVTEDGLILSGVRRFKAYQRLRSEAPHKFSHHLIVKLSTTCDPLEHERIVIATNTQRVKTKGMIAREAAALLRIEKALAAERERAGKPSVNLRKGRASKLVGEQLGISERTVEKAAAVVGKAVEGEPGAVQVLQELDSNNVSIGAAFKRVTKPKDTAAITAHDQEAKKLTAALKDRGFDAQVARAKDNGKYHLTLRGLTADQIREFAK